MRMSGQKSHTRKRNKLSRSPKLSLVLAFLSSVSFTSIHAAAQTTDEAANVVNENGLSDAAENLSRILRSAKEKGLVQAKKTTQTTEASNETPAVNCDIGEILKFTSLQPIETYEDLTMAKSVRDEMNDVYGALHLARVQLSLGLNTEAKATLAPYETIEADLLVRAAGLLTHPHFDIDAPIIEAFAHCNTQTKIWAMLENPEYFREPISAENRRKIVNEVAVFPKFLRETISVNLGIKAAETGEINLARALWAKMDTEARENGTRLPDEKLDKHDYLYLNGLLNKDSDPDFYISVLNYLSEREGEFRLTALTQLSKENRSSTAKINTTLEDDLVEVSQTFSNGSESQLAALELVKNRIHVGRAIDAITATKKYFNPTDAEFRQSVLQITELVQTRLQSESNLKRIVGLNDYLFDTAFFEEGGDTDGLKTQALNAALLSNLPELHEKIFVSEEDVPKDAKPLLKQARFFANLKSGKTQDEPETIRSVSLSNTLAQKTGEQALAENNLNLARSMAAKMSDNNERQDLLQNIAWIEGRWSDTMKKSDDIVQVLTNPTSQAISADDRQWVKKLPEKLSSIETTLQHTQDYLKNG